MFGRRPRLTPEQKAERAAANKAEKAAREAKAMTCQCCGRKILAEKGRIAHHGYNRPGHGYQTPSCVGAKRLPFEVDRAALMDLLDGLTLYKHRLLERIKGIRDELLPVAFSYVDFSAPREGRSFRHPTVTTTFSRIEFDRLMAEDSKFSTAVRRTAGYLGRANFDAMKEDNLKKLDFELGQLVNDINAQQRRYDGWVKTHEWNKETKTWQTL